MGIEIKSLGILIDELCTTSQKCFIAQDVVMENESVDKVAAAAINAQKLNARRNALIKAIDDKFGEGDTSPTGKTYE